MVEGYRAGSSGRCAGGADTRTASGAGRSCCSRQHASAGGVLGRVLFVVALCAIILTGPASALPIDGRRSLRGGGRQLLQTGGAPPSPSPPALLGATLPPLTANGTTAAANGTTSTPLPPAPEPAPPAPEPAPAPPPPETAKEKLEEKWEKLGEGKSPAEKGIAITVGVLMLVCILTCLVCCVFRRGGQWRVPGLPWLKRKFSRQPESKYSRYMQNNDDGF